MASSYLAAPGSPEYLQSILNKIGETHPELPVDPVILQSLLLCLVAGRYHENRGQCSQTHTRSKNLILRTKEEDVAMVVNIVGMILATVFGFPTYKSRLKPLLQDSGSTSARRKKAAHSPTQQHPEAFLRSLFFREPKSSPLVRDLAAERDRRDSGSRKSTRRVVKRASTLPSPLEHTSTGSVSAPPTITHTIDTTDDSFLESSTLASSRRPLITPTSTLRSRPQAPRMQTEPSPLMSVFAPPLGASWTSSVGQGSHVSGSSVLPKALVVSGLQHANIPSQRSLMQVLNEKRLTLDGEDGANSEGHEPIGETWNLPDDFICVYVCSSNPHERPEILPGLVDKFSMSVEINVSSNTRLAYGTHRTSQASTPMASPFHPSAQLPGPPPRSPLNPNASLPSSDSIHTMRASYFRPGQSHSPHARSPSTLSPPVVTATDLAQLRALASPKPIAPLNSERYDMITQFVHAHTCIHPSLAMYLSDLFAATRHHPELDGSHLTLQAHRDAEDLVRAFRVIGGDTLGAELVERTANRPPSLRVSESTDSYDRVSRMDIESIGWGKEEGDILMTFDTPAMEVRLQVPDTPDHNGHAPFYLGLDTKGSHTTAMDEQWDVSEVDIARIFPRVVSHRLSVRRGPDDEILGSVMFPAVAHDIFTTDQRRSVVVKNDGMQTIARRTVKEILVGILADV